MENSTNVAVLEQQNNQVATVERSSIISVVQSCEIDNMGQDDILSMFETAETVPFKQNLTLWDPPKDKDGNSIPGSQFVGLFVGLSVISLPSMKDGEEGVMQDVDIAVFLSPEPLLDNKGNEVSKQLTMKAIAARRAYGFFKNGLMVDGNGNQKTPINSMWKIVFKGEVKNKTNQKKSNDYDFYPMLTKKAS